MRLLTVAYCVLGTNLYLRCCEIFTFFYYRNEDNIETKIDSLAKEIISQTGSNWMEQIGDERPAVAEVRPKELHNKVSRAFKHCITGQFLAESGECFIFKVYIRCML